MKKAHLRRRLSLGGGLDGPLPNLPHEVAPAKPALESPPRAPIEDGSWTLLISLLEPSP